MGRPGWKTVPVSWEIFLEEVRYTAQRPCTWQKGARAFCSLPACFLSPRLPLSFPQRTLPLLENQMKELQQSVTEQLQKYGMDIPEDESEKMFFLIDVSMARGIALKNHTWSG